MNDVLISLVLFLIVGLFFSAVVLPIIALVVSIRSKRNLAERISKFEALHLKPYKGDQTPPISLAAIQQLNARIEKLEAAIKADSPSISLSDDKPGAALTEQPPLPIPENVSECEPTRSASETPPPVTEALPASLPVSPLRIMDADRIESIIGRRWLGWAAVSLILFATAFFFKYAFDNRWIGELGRVTIGVTAGVILTVLGLRYHHRRWRVFSQILTAGGIVLLYLSVYAAFAYYHLATQKVAFFYLAILVAEAAGLAYLYNAPAIAIMALIGGFLAPVLLRSDRDQYRSLFGYIAALDVGALALLKHWRGLSSLAFAGTHLLFWLWYDSNYHPQKLVAVIVFQTVVFLIFLLAHVGRQLLRPQPVTLEEIGLLLINPFVFFATSYHLLNPNHHDWMAAFAISLALLYAVAAKLLLNRSAATKNELLTMIGVAITFVTIAIPIQLQGNWITIAWSIEALVILWAGIETRTQRLRVMAYILFGLALMRLVFWDTPRFRPLFTPVFNKYFLSSLVVTLCLFAAALTYQKLGARKGASPPGVMLAILLAGIVTLWFVMSVETYTFFAARAAAQKLPDDAAAESWLGQMALSVLWSLFAGALAAAGFIRRSAGVRWASLALFGLTIIKVMLVDIAQLRQFYRIIAFLVLGLLLLVVAWGYHKAFHSRESAK